MEKTLVLMRHGETLFNALHKIQGWCDSPLTQRGIEQAKAAGKKLRERGFRFDHAYSSTSELLRHARARVRSAVYAPERTEGKQLRIAGRGKRFSGGKRSRPLRDVLSSIRGRIEQHDARPHGGDADGTHGKRGPSMCAGRLAWRGVLQFFTRYSGSIRGTEKRVWQRLPVRVWIRGGNVRLARSHSVRTRFGVFFFGKL